jgi:hypothetical protein
VWTVAPCSIYSKVKLETFTVVLASTRNITERNPLVPFPVNIYSNEPVVPSDITFSPSEGVQVPPPLFDVAGFIIKSPPLKVFTVPVTLTLHPSKSLAVTKASVVFK